MKWIGFSVVRGNGHVAKKLRALGFFKAGERMGFNYVRPCGLNCCETLGKMRDLGIKGVANCFTDAEWILGRKVSRNSEINYAD